MLLLSPDFKISLALIKIVIVPSKDVQADKYSILILKGSRDLSDKKL